MSKPYQPPSIIEALKPYRYPEDEHGNPIPTPSPRKRPPTRAADGEVRVLALSLPLPLFLERFGGPPARK
jgi:hypothetical protein